MTEEEKAVAVQWPCGCITCADSQPSRMTVKFKRQLADQVAEGASVIRATPDELRAMPDFLPAECPHEPKGWSR